MNTGDNLFKKEIKNKDVRIRVTKDEKKQIDELAKDRGMTVSNYLRYCILLEIKHKKENESIEK